MWSLKAWRRRKILKRHPISEADWQLVFQRIPITDGLTREQDALLRERAVLFLQEKHLTILPGIELGHMERLHLAVQAQLMLLELDELDWFSGFHEIVLYPDDFISPQRHRDASGIEHEFNQAHSGEAWSQGPIILAWPGVASSGQWEGYNLVIHELAHKLDMLSSGANGLPPLHGDMRLDQWASAMQSAYDALNATLDANPHTHTPIDPYAAENPAEFFAVTSEYFFSAPDILHQAMPKVYEQLAKIGRAHV